MISLNDKKSLASLRIELDAALAKLGEKHGLKIHAGNARFEGDGSSVEFKLSIARINTDGSVESKERAAFRQLAASFGMKPTDLDRKLVIGSRMLTIVGLMPRRSKPIVLKEQATGREYLYPVEPIVAMLNKPLVSA